MTGRNNVQSPDHIVRALLEVDLRLVEDGHARIEQFLLELCGICCKFDGLEACQGCDKGKIASCQGRFPSFTYDFLDLVVKHIENEDKIMSEFPETQANKPLFESHMKSHSGLIRELESMIHALSIMNNQGHTAMAIREFHHMAVVLLSEHARTFDDHLMQLLQGAAYAFFYESNAKGG